MTIQSWIAEARGRCERATKGPWEVHPNPRYYVLLPTDDWGDPNRDGNAAFCAAARTDLPRALEAIERLMQFVDHEDSLWGDPNNPAAQARADVERILTRAAKP